jgi:hypothetical protein
MRPALAFLLSAIASLSIAAPLAAQTPLRDVTLFITYQYDHCPARSSFKPGLCLSNPGPKRAVTGIMIYFSPRGATYIYTEPETGVVLAPGQTTASQNIKGRQYTLQVTSWFPDFNFDMGSYGTEHFSISIKGTSCTWLAYGFTPPPPEDGFELRVWGTQGLNCVVKRGRHPLPENGQWP